MTVAPIKDPTSIIEETRRRLGLRVADGSDAPKFPDLSNEQWDKLELWLEYKYNRLPPAAQTTDRALLAAVAYREVAESIRRIRPGLLARSKAVVAPAIEIANE